MEILVKVTQFLLSLSILVVLHEMGHFLFAKAFKTRVEKFYMFFNPWFSLFKFKKGETEYGIGWLPLGGYVKISGMIDESMDKEQMKQEPQPYEFRSKKAWQRLLIMVGGVLVNFVLAFAIYIGVLFTWGDTYLPAENAKYGIVCDSLAQSIGLENGDIIVSLDNKKIERFSSITSEILFSEAKTIQLIRKAEQKSIDIPEWFVPKLMARSSESFDVNPLISLRYPFGPYIVANFAKESLANKAGLKVNDEIVGVDSVQFDYLDQFISYLQARPEKEIVLNVKRSDKYLNIHLKLDKTAKIGVMGKNPSIKFDYKVKEYGFFESIPAGINKGFASIANYIKQFKLIFSSKAQGYKSLGGFLTIGNIFPASWNWQAFWNLTALLSIILAVMNILPIPALDGGHVMFLLYEIITGRKPGDKFMEYAQIAGMVLLLGLLLFANANDVMKLFK
ncbi:MAG: RIP metalloprotease RseP [Marinifilaceae bacterium]|jgi:regulator of sigma E protease|nr:RIP metalloprotease RseP [Marinifilaceae bacterium]